ncbi:MAG: ABC transporter ATP-binding protein [Chloroflexi bacterium]|nr:ABC transporter ATP-binding protein [Chloroflexota bacterium]
MPIAFGVLEPNPPIVAMDHVTRRYGDLAAVDDVSLEVPRGTILGVIGPSGSGKTTLVRMLTGTLAPTDGNLTVLGEQPRKFKRRTRERLGYMPQHFVLYDELTAWENVSFVASLFGLLWPRRGKRVKQMLTLLDLWDARNRRARQLSGGMQRRLELACAMVHDPVLLFVDEPTAGLDPMLRETVWNEFRRLRDAGRTLVVTTQVVSEAAYCDSVAVLAHGGLIALAPPEELRRRASGGDVIEIKTATAFDGVILNDLPEVREVRQHAPREILVITDDAATTTPRVVEAIQSAGGTVVSSSEYRPTFDEVFSRLVSRAEAQSEADTATAEENAVGEAEGNRDPTVARAA